MFSWSWSRHIPLKNSLFSTVNLFATDQPVILRKNSSWCVHMHERKRFFMQKTPVLNSTFYVRWPCQAMNPIVPKKKRKKKNQEEDRTRRRGVSARRRTHVVAAVTRARQSTLRPVCEGTPQSCTWKLDTVVHTAADSQHELRGRRPLLAPCTL